MPIECEVLEAGKGRNGMARYWCRTHRMLARYSAGCIPERCEKFGEPATQKEAGAKVLSLADYPGGLAIWGAVQPVLNTTTRLVHGGVHVHGRISPEGDKVVDRTFDAIRVNVPFDLVENREIVIDGRAAISWFVSKYAGVPLDACYCKHCGEAHLDEDLFAVQPHIRHLCHDCGKYFPAPKKCVSNPLEALHKAYFSQMAERSIKRASRYLECSQNDFPGGIMIWASNPAIFWTSDRPEEEGLHVHAYDAHGHAVENETFDHVSINGIELDENAARLFMVQKAMPSIANRLHYLECRKCGATVHDEGETAFIPSRRRKCGECGTAALIPGGRTGVANRFLQDLFRLNIKT